MPINIYYYYNNKIYLYAYGDSTRTVTLYIYIQSLFYIEYILLRIDRLCPGVNTILIFSSKTKTFQRKFISRCVRALKRLSRFHFPVRITHNTIRHRDSVNALAAQDRSTCTRGHTSYMTFEERTVPIIIIITIYWLVVVGPIKTVNIVNRINLLLQRLL